MSRDENTLSDRLPQEFFELLDHLSDAVLLTDQDGTIVHANRTLARQLGVSARRLKGPLSAFIGNPQQVADYLTLCRGTKDSIPGGMTFLIDGKESVFRSEGSLLKRDGPHAILMCRLIPREAAVSRFVALNQRVDQLSQEIARRQILEREIRDQQEWFQITLSSIGDAVIATDDHGAVMFINPEAEKLTGWQRKEAHGLPLLSVFCIVNEDTRQPAEDPVQRVLTEGITVGLANHTALITKGGSEHSIEDSAAPIYNGDGRMIGVVLVFHDVTDKRRIEKELRRSQEDLHERVNELEQFHDAVVGRELKMIELEREIAGLRAKAEKG
jgi:PAS domain S-box-containing protein